MNREITGQSRGVGFYISMLGLGEIPMALLIMYVIDEVAPMTVIANVSFGQAIATLLILHGLFLFWFGRRKGWQPTVAHTNNPVRRP